MHLGHPDAVTILLNEDPNCHNHTDTEGNTPLSCAAMLGHTAVAEMLIARGAQVRVLRASLRVCVCVHVVCVHVRCSYIHRRVCSSERAMQPCL